MKVDFRQLMVGYKSAKDLPNGTHSSMVHRPEMIYAILMLCLLGSCGPAMAQKAEKDPLAKDQNSRLAGIYVKDGNENGQLRFLASGLNSGSSSTGSSNTGINSALNQYITNKQDMLEQLRPTSGATSTGTGGVTGTTTGTTSGTTSGTGTGLVTTTTNGAIYVNLGNSGSSSSSSSSSSATNAAINQVIYGSSPVAGLLPQIVGQAVSSRVRPGGQNNRRRVPARRRRVNKRRGSINNNNQRRRRRGNKRGKNKAQVMVVRPNRG
ncbi:cell wall protein IFF6 [Drosophila sechellia]|uniref:GM18844 n=1 Tax=Drosophila sechellia TaxID=7238 RepID=B4IA23_DROSE|nr:cell wall protein IFF6 [Drosophila sechellia]EDW44054.1 GM18844 [Drosophila sechellia]